MNLERYLGQEHNKWPKALANALFKEKDELTLTAFALAVVYLEKLLLAEVSIPVAEFYT